MKTLLAGAQILKLEKIVQMFSAITLFVSSAQAIVNCPSCQTVTTEVHSRYERAAADLPWSQFRSAACTRAKCAVNLACGLTRASAILDSPNSRQSRSIIFVFTIRQNMR